MTKLDNTIYYFIVTGGIVLPKHPGMLPPG